MAPKAIRGPVFTFIIAVALACSVLAPVAQTSHHPYSKYRFHMPLDCSLSFRI